VRAARTRPEAPERHATAWRNAPQREDSHSHDQPAATAITAAECAEWPHARRIANRPRNAHASCSVCNRVCMRWLFIAGVYADLAGAIVIAAAVL
jgi:hypothetical protein